MAPGVHAMVRKYFERSNTIGQGKAGQHQMDHSSCVLFEIWAVCREIVLHTGDPQQIITYLCIYLKSR